jgi:hypothetical protein
MSENVCPGLFGTGSWKFVENDSFRFVPTVIATMKIHPHIAFRRGEWLLALSLAEM